MISQDAVATSDDAIRNRVNNVQDEQQQAKENQHRQRQQQLKDVTSAWVMTSQGSCDRVVSPTLRDQTGSSRVPVGDDVTDASRPEVVFSRNSKDEDVNLKSVGDEASTKTIEQNVNIPIVKTTSTDINDVQNR